MDVGQQKIIKQIIEHQKLFNITIIPSLKMEHYAILLKNSLCLIGNSSSGIRECEYLGVPVVNIGTRQNKRLRGKNVIDVDYKSEEITKAIKFQINNGHYKSEFIYGHGSSGKIICDALAKCKLSLDKFIIY